MFQSLKKMWQNSAENAAPRTEHDISLAVTALMVQVMQQDDQLQESEYQEIISNIQNRFDLSENEAREHIALATQEELQANDLHQFTAPLIKAYSQQERIDIIRQLWRIAMADGHIDSYEEALIRKIAELIGVHHHQFIDAKISARQSK